MFIDDTASITTALFARQYTQTVLAGMQGGTAAVFTVPENGFTTNKKGIL